MEQPLTGAQAELLAVLQKYERQVSPGQFAKRNEPWFKCLGGRRPVLVSAPHACRHLRSGAEKMAEEFTAAIACYLASQTNCHAIFAINKTAEDPNWVSSGDYKDAVRDIVARNRISLLIDLHGMTNRHNMGVALGTMHGRSCPQVELKTPFLSQGFVLTGVDDLPPKVARRSALPMTHNEGAGESESWRKLVIDHPRFTGGLRSQTVTRFAVEELGISAVQVEIASVARIVHQKKTGDWPYEYSGNAQAIIACVSALCALIEGNS